MLILELAVSFVFVCINSQVQYLLAHQYIKTHDGNAAPVEARSKQHANEKVQNKNGRVRMHRVYYV